MRSELIINTLRHGQIAVESEHDLGPEGTDVVIVRGITIHFRYVHTNLPSGKRVYKSSNDVDLLATEVDAILNAYAGKTLSR